MNKLEAVRNQFRNYFRSKAINSKLYYYNLDEFINSIVGNEDAW